MTPHYGADYLVACQRIQQIGGVIQMRRGNKRRVPQSSPQKTTTSTCEDKRMQRCPGSLSNRVTTCVAKVIGFVCDHELCSCGPCTSQYFCGERTPAGRALRRRSPSAEQARSQA